jgi:hypothetical protein
MTDGQSASLPWCQAHIWGPRPEFYYCQTVACLLMWGALCDERTGCRLQLLLDLASAVILESESCGIHDHILLSQIRDSTNLEGQVPVFISLRKRVAQLYPRVPDSFFVASYGSQGYGGGIRTSLHAGMKSESKLCYDQRSVVSLSWVKSKSKLLYDWWLNIQSVPHGKHSVSITTASRFMLLGEIIAVYCDNHTEHIDTLRGQNI